ncbi:MAG: TetR/AcrR family transcriptional regulator [Phycisphaerales bacterium JB050]
MKTDSKTKFLDAALTVVRTKGYAATTVEDICHEAGLTKGSFFHHFKSKEELALLAAEHFAAMADQLFCSAPFNDLKDPLERLLGYIDFRREILRGETHEFTCLLGTMVQETHDTHPAIREACERGISSHASTLEQDIAAAKALYAPDAPWTVESLALFTQAVLQGAFILAKAKQETDVAAECVVHLRRYIENQFAPLRTTEE